MKFVSLQLFYCILVIFAAEGRRKYDLAEEAYKMYGRSLESVLAAFRSSADYVKILDDKVDALKIELQDISYHTMNFYENKMKNRIAEMFGVNMRTVDVIEKPHVRLSLRSSKSGNATEMKKLEHIDRIDDYFKLTSFLTLEEKNRFNDIGFEYMAACIHSFTENMEGDVTPEDHTHKTTTTTESDDGDSTDQGAVDEDIDMLWNAMKNITENTNFNIGL